MHYARLTEKDVNALSLELSGMPVPVNEKMDIGCDLFAENIFFWLKCSLIKCDMWMDNIYVLILVK